MIDVVVVSFNSRGELRGCVAALADAPEIEVTVVDNASPDGSLETVAGLPVRSIQLPRNGGFAVGCNAGWRAGSAPYVLFLNPDARIDPAAVECLAAVVGDPKAGAAAPRIVDADGSLDISLRRFPRARSTFAQALFLHRLFPEADWVDEVIRDPKAYADPHPVDWASGACLMVRRDVLERIGGFDEGFFMYCEDTDLCKQVWDLGLEVRFEPAAVSVHAGGRSAPRASLLPVLAASRIRYARKHGGRRAALVERVGVVLGAATHATVGRGGWPARSGHLQAAARALAPRPSSEP